MLHELQSQLPLLVKHGLVVHLCSNMGYYMWYHILGSWGELLPPVATVLRCVVHECNPNISLEAGGEGHNQACAAYLKGVIGTVQQYLKAERIEGLVYDLCVSSVLDVAPGMSECHSGAMLHEHGQNGMAHVPRLFLYSRGDALIPALQVERYIEQQRAAGSRCEVIAVEWVPHMMIPILAMDSFCDPILSFVSEQMSSVKTRNFELGFREAWAEVKTSFAPPSTRRLGAR